jgi:glycine cleavage system transcriptional repressor
MEKLYIMTAFGKDRPGVVADVTRLIYESGCNLEDSAMTLLLDEFAMILLFTGKAATLSEDLSRECRRLEKEKGISAFFRILEKSSKSAGNGYNRHTLHVEGIDQAGIVYRVSRHLAELGINIANLSSHRKSLPESGTAMYRMNIDIQVPVSLSPDDLNKSLHKLGEEIHVDIAVDDPATGNRF